MCGRFDGFIPRPPLVHDGGGLAPQRNKVAAAWTRHVDVGQAGRGIDEFVLHYVSLETHQALARTRECNVLAAQGRGLLVLLRCEHVSWGFFAGRSCGGSRQPGLDRRLSGLCAYSHSGSSRGTTFQPGARSRAGAIPKSPGNGTPPRWLANRESSSERARRKGSRPTHHTLTCVRFWTVRGRPDRMRAHTAT